MSTQPIVFVSSDFSPDPSVNGLMVAGEKIGLDQAEGGPVSPRCPPCGFYNSKWVGDGAAAFHGTAGRPWSTVARAHGEHPDQHIGRAAGRPTLVCPARSSR